MPKWAKLCSSLSATWPTCKPPLPASLRVPSRNSIFPLLYSWKQVCPDFAYIPGDLLADPLTQLFKANRPFNLLVFPWSNFSKGPKRLPFLSRHLGGTWSRSFLLRRLPVRCHVRGRAFFAGSQGTLCLPYAERTPDSSQSERLFKSKSEYPQLLGSLPTTS